MQLLAPQLALSASDGMALTMVALLAFAFGIVLTIIVTVARNAARRHEIEEHEEHEVHHDHRPPLPGKISRRSPPSEKTEDWERDADWWRK